MTSFDPHFDNQLIRSLMQLATRTRPDIWFTVRKHWTFARRVEHYLNNFQDSLDFLSSEQGGPVTHSPMLKAAEKSRCGSCIFFFDLVGFWK
jgi:hypothetical protein